jgi:hypothetical protein
MSSPSHPIPYINPIVATREEMRAWISATSRTLAAHFHGSPTIASLREVMKLIGHPSLSAVIAEGTMEVLRDAVTNLRSIADKNGLLDMSTALTSSLPPPPAEIPVAELRPPSSAPDSFPDGMGATVTHLPVCVADDYAADDEADRLSEEALSLARRAAEAAKIADAARRAAASPRHAAGMTEEDKGRLSAVESLANTTAGAVRDEATRLSAIESRLAPLTAVLDALSASGSGSPPTLPPAVMSAAKAAVSGDRLLTEVLPFFTPGIPQGNQIPCVASPPSFGKTFMSDEISRLYEGAFFHPFKDSLDEIDSLVGTLMPRSDGTFAVIDGPLVSAARLAATGVNVLFVGDEIFNASKKTLEWMQSFLSPRLVEFTNPDGTTGLRRCFVIQTKHSLEDGTFEVLKAPEDCLHFLFLGNLRSNPPEALMSRCRLMRFDYEPKWAMETALQRLEGYSGGLFSGADAKEWATRWASAMTLSREAYSRMEVSRPLCFRFLIGAVSHVARQPGASLSMLVDYVAKWAPHQIAVQNAATQDTDTTSAAVVKKIIATAFPPAAK